MPYRDGLSALKKQILSTCCPPVRSGVPFFRVFFSHPAGAKKPPFLGGFTTIFVWSGKWRFRFIYAVFGYNLTHF
jgi:hypothetical protein